MLSDMLQIEWLQNQLSDYLIALGTLIGGIVITKLVQNLVVMRLKQWARRTSTTLDDDLIRLFERALIPLIFLGIFYISVHNLVLHPVLNQAIDVLSIGIATVLGIRLLGSLVEYVIRIYCFSKAEVSPGLEQSLNGLIPAIKIMIWAVGIVFLLDNLGFDISAVVAGLGIGGVAIALASQGVLQDLFSYFSILLDRPFEIGDFIIVGDYIGTVEYIGIKTTRLRSITGEQLVVANTDLTGSRIRNYKRMQRRRIVFEIGVTYETGLSQLETIPELIKTILEGTENTLFDRAHFSSYGDFSLNFEVVYFVTTSDYTAYMDAQQHINLELKREFEQRGIEFAYPTQVTYLNNPSKEGLLVRSTADQADRGNHHQQG